MQNISNVYIMTPPKILLFAKLNYTKLKPVPVQLTPKFNGCSELGIIYV